MIGLLSVIVGGSVVGCSNAGGRGEIGSIVAGNDFKCVATGSAATRHVAVSGLIGHSSADDFSAIQDAINVAGRDGGGIVSLPAGTFVIENHLMIRDNVELKGAGPRTVIKAGPGFMRFQGPGGGYPIITTDGARNVTVADLTAHQSGGKVWTAIPMLGLRDMLSRAVLLIMYFSILSMYVIRLHMLSPLGILRIFALSIVMLWLVPTIGIVI